MLTEINPKIPMRNKAATKDFYLNKLGFKEFGNADHAGYLMVQKDNIQIHFFEFKELDPKENYGQVYIRTDDIDKLYQSMLDKKLMIHPTEPRRGFNKCTDLMLIFSPLESKNLKSPTSNLPS